MQTTLLSKPNTAEANSTGAATPLGFNISELENARHSRTFWAVEPPLPISEPPRSQQLVRNSRFVPLCFDNGEACFRDLSTAALIRSISVFQVCGWTWLVKHADTLYGWSQRHFGWTGVPSFLVRNSFFAQFCAGEDQESIQPTIKRLHRLGIGAILDYAAESDVHTERGVAGAGSLSDSNYEVIVRTYEYESEKKCDAQVGIFMKALDAARTLPGQGFAAIKEVSKPHTRDLSSNVQITALGNPELLKQLSRTLAEVTHLFSRFDRGCDGYIGKDEFFEVYRDLFVDNDDADALFSRLDLQHDDRVDYVSFVDRIKLADIPGITQKCRHSGPLKEATPTSQELELMDNMLERVRTLCRSAAQANLRIMIDAEHQYFQPAIDSIAKDMMREFNRDVPIVYNTYQCYLKDSRFRLNADIESARRQGYKFGGKLVRGAYMVLERGIAEERSRAKKRPYASPIHNNLVDTHTNYNRCVRILIQEAATCGAEVMIATHNQYSVEMAVRSMHDFGLKPEQCGVYFGQLLGMADHLSLVLGRHKYRAYKYVPFGPLQEVMPYLIRRAQENSDIMGGVGKEMDMLKAEVKRRLTGVE